MNNNFSKESSEPSSVNENTQKTEKTSIIYKLLAIFFISCVLLLQRISGGSVVSVCLNPIMLSVLVGMLYVANNKISYADLIFESKFSLFVLSAIIAITAFSSIFLENKPAIFVFYGVSIFMYGFLWGLSNISAGLYLAKEMARHYYLPRSLVFMYYLIGGVSTLIILYLAIIIQLQSQPIYLLLLGIIINLLSFASGILLAMSLITILSYFRKDDVSYELKKELLKVNGEKLSPLYKSFSWFCVAYICIIFILASFQINVLAFSVVPSLLGVIIFVYLLNQKKYSYEITMMLSNRVVIFGLIWLVLALVPFYYASQIDAIHLKEFVNNMLILNSSGLIEYSSVFYFSFNVLAFGIIGLLLSLNNTTNDYNYYAQKINGGHSVFRMIITILLFQLIGVYFIFESIKDGTLLRLDYFVAVLLLTSFIALITARFLGFIIIKFRR